MASPSPVIGTTTHSKRYCHLSLPSSCATSALVLEQVPVLGAGRVMKLGRAARTLGAASKLAPKLPANEDDHLPTRTKHGARLKVATSEIERSRCMTSPPFESLPTAVLPSIDLNEVLTTERRSPV